MYLLYKFLLFQIPNLYIVFGYIKQTIKPVFQASEGIGFDIKGIGFDIEDGRQV